MLQLQKLRTTMAHVENCRVAVEIGMAMGNSIAVISIRIYIDTNRCNSARSAIASACGSNSKQQRRRRLQRVHAAC